MKGLKLLVSSLLFSAPTTQICRFCPFLVRIRSPCIPCRIVVCYIPYNQRVYSISVFQKTLHLHGGVAQLGERTVRIRKVEGSIPFVSTTNKQRLQMQSLLVSFQCRNQRSNQPGRSPWEPGDSKSSEASVSSRNSAPHHAWCVPHGSSFSGATAVASAVSAVPSAR